MAKQRVSADIIFRVLFHNFLFPTLTHVFLALFVRGSFSFRTVNS